MAKKKKTKTIGVTDVRKQLQTIGDTTKDIYDSTKDLKAASTAISAYKGALIAGKAQLTYKKATGKPGKINFFEK